MGNNKQVKRYSKKVGMPPGTLIYTGDKKSEKVRLTLIDYDEKNFQEKECKSVDELLSYKTKPTVTWINIDGLWVVSNVEEIGNIFELHPLILEDILNIGQRAKCECYDEHIFIVIKMLTYDEGNKSIQSEQVSLILGNSYVVSFQEMVGDVFEQIRDRLRNSKGRIRKMSADYLMYAILDAIVDNYFLVLEKIGEEIGRIEDELIESPVKNLLYDIHRIKRELLFLRKSVWPLRELINTLDKSESSLINDSTQPYFRDIYDHTIQVIDTVETYRDMVSGMLDIYLSSVSNKMNAVMKVLTVIATIFMPLSFIAGIYGMNFKNIPELQWKYSYPVFWLIIISLSVSMLIYFKRKKWL